MISKTEAICIKNTRYSESSVICKMFTSEHGLSSYLIQGINRKSSQIKPSHISPGNIVEMIIYEKPNTSVQRIKELRVLSSQVSVQTDMSKNLILQFMLEIIAKTNEEHLKDELMFDFLKKTIDELETSEQLGYLPSYFLCNYLKYSGWFPNLEIWKEGYIFNLMEGRFESQDDSKIVNDLRPEQSKELFNLLYSIQNNERPEKGKYLSKRELFRTLLTYFEIHILKGKKIKSPAILSEVLA